MNEVKDEEVLDYELKEQELDDEEENRLARYQINSYSVDRSIETLIKWKENGKLIVPDFQRDYVWSFSNSSRFIDSILLSLPIPNIFVFKVIRDNAEKYLLVDGMQRITTMQQFKNGVWKQNEKTKKFKIKSKSSNWYGKTYEELSENDKQFFLDYPISMMIFETNNATEKENNNSIFSVFERINTGSEKLSDQEIRNAVYDGKCLNKIKESCENEAFKQLIARDSKLFRRDKYIEFFIRLITYNTIFRQQIKNSTEMVDNVSDSKIVNSKKTSLNQYLYYSNIGLIDFTNDINNVLKACKTVFDYDNTLFYNVMRNENKTGSRVHEVFAEALIVAVINNNYEINIDKNKMWERKRDLWKNTQQFYSMFVEKTTDPSSVVKRTNFVKNIING